MRTWRHRSSGHRKRGQLDCPEREGRIVDASPCTCGGGPVRYPRFRLHLDLGRLSSSLCPAIRV